MGETAPRTYPKRLQCDANPVLQGAMQKYMQASGVTVERRAVETLIRESLERRGHLPAPR